MNNISIYSYIKMGNSSSSGCATTNQGGTMDDIRDEIRIINSNTKQLIAAARDDIGNYANNVTLLDLIKKNKAAEDAYKILKTTNDTLKTTNDTLKTSNDTLETNYIIEQGQLSGNIVALRTNITNKTGILNGLSTDITNIEVNTIRPKITNIEGKYEEIKEIVKNNDKAAILSNNKKTDIQQASFSIAYLEYLVIDAYKQLYRSVYYENVSVGDGIKQRFDNHTNQFSINNYQNNRIQFYKNINTFLFYFYYIMIIALVIVVLKFNSTSLLIKLTFFRVFAILLILYPLFIIRLQNFIYKFFTLLLSKL